MDIQKQQNITTGVMTGALGAGVGTVAAWKTNHSRIKTIKKLDKDEFQKLAQDIKAEKKLANLPEYLKSKDGFIKFLKENKKKVTGKYALIGALVGVGAVIVKSLIFNNKAKNINQQYANQTPQIQQQALNQQYANQAPDQIPQQLPTQAVENIAKNPLQQNIQQEVQPNVQPDIQQNVQQGVQQNQTPQVQMSPEQMLQQVQQMRQDVSSKQTQAIS